MPGKKSLGSQNLGHSNLISKGTGDTTLEFCIVELKKGIKDKLQMDKAE